MRTFNFKARNIGQEKYLTYTMGEECELDEDVLDYCEENNLKELVKIIYEEDEDYDYLTYDITGKRSVCDFISGEVSAVHVLNILRNVANNLISLKEQAIHLSYVLLNKNYMYVNEETMDVEFICLPIESEASVITEFKGFMRQLLANMKYDVEEDLNYVGKLLTYINGDNFNLRGLVGLSEALMEEYGLSFEAVGDIEADGIEIVDAEQTVEEEQKVVDFMNELDSSSEELPEIGDDEEEPEEKEEEEETVDDKELDSILPVGTKTENTTEKPSILEENRVINAAQNDNKETDVEVIKNRIKQIVGDVPSAKTKETETKSINTLEELDQMLGSKPPVIKKNVVKVNRAALIQSAAAELEETAELTSNDNPSSVSKDTTEGANGDKDDKPKSNSILSKSVPEVQKKNTLVNAPKAMPYLIRVNTEERIMLGKMIFKIGKATRGVDYTVSGNGAISRQHAVITQKDGVCYIKDNKSTNHTYVNDRIIDDGVEEILTHDSLIRLGDEEFIFKIR